MLKEKDIMIINELRKNSREQIKTISKKIKSPISSTFLRIKKINRLIKKYTTMLNYKNLYYPLHIIFIIKSTKKHKEYIEDIISKNRNINNIYRINNGFNYIIDCYFKDLEEINNFEKSIDNKSRGKIIKHEIIKEIEIENFLLPN